VWINGNNAMGLGTVFHELGHTLGLRHSTSPGNEYGDAGCAMGSCCSIRCYNAPQSWRAGLARPIANLDNSTKFEIGVWMRYVLPATPINDTNFIRVSPTWLGTASSSYSSYFFSYRQPIGWDKALMVGYKNGIHVHVYNGSGAPAAGNHPTEYQWLLRQVRNA
jgi:hypothetical protein